MEREAGVLLAVSSLPSREGIGTLGKGAYDFVRFLSSAGFKVWQVLPLTPTREGNSPYSSVSATALNPLFIDLFDLAERGLLKKEEIPAAPAGKVDYAALAPQKGKLLRLAFSRFDLTDDGFCNFVNKGEYAEYAAFSTMTEVFGGKPFWLWQDGYNNCDLDRVQAFLHAHLEEYLYHLFTQYVFDLQWSKLKAFAKEQGVKIFGDMPIYVAMNSAEVYFHPELFLFDKNRRPVKVAGVPPDYFNSEGQLWGNPLYDWAAMKKDGYAWWRRRIQRELERFDILRIDHFRGLDRFYAIDADATDAKHGVWMDGPGAALFEGIKHLPIVAEDLGFVDESLKKMLEEVGFPGMKVFEFGLNGDPWCEHKPANYKENVVAYTGTHDNMPFRGYLDSLEGKEFAIAARDVLVQATALSVPVPDSLDLAKEGKTTQEKIERLESLSDDAFLGLPAPLLTDLAAKTLLSSKARLAMVPMQDLLALGEESRMNTPALVSEVNWSWRLAPALLTSSLTARLKGILQTAKRG